MMEDMDKDTVDFVPNYDETQDRTGGVPAAFPNFLVNGGTGIAVGMATNIPPHNLGEVIDGICAQIDNPEITLPELMQHIKGPDFPRPAAWSAAWRHPNYFRTGRGSLKVRGRVGDRGKQGRPSSRSSSREIPYGVNRADLVRTHRRAGQRKDPGPHRHHRGARRVGREHPHEIEIKRDAVRRWSSTTSSSSPSSRPRSREHAGHRPRPAQDSSQPQGADQLLHRAPPRGRPPPHPLSNCGKAEERAECSRVTSSRSATSTSSSASSAIRKNRDEARVKLLAFEFSRPPVESVGHPHPERGPVVNGRYAFTERQVDAILELRLYQLTALEIAQGRGRIRQLLERIKDLLDILAREERVLAIIKDELQAIKEKYATRA
jgi:DNA gyrase subunit A